MAMRVDISEIKTYRQCPRKWQFTSRNAYHMRPVVTPRHFTFGTIFHEALHQLYLGANPDKVLQWVGEQIDVANNPGEAALLSMIRGYIDEVLPQDLERYEIIEVEHHFEEPLTENIKLCGSIDMIAYDREEQALVAFEHKTCKNFRTGAYLALDDQLRVYNWVLSRMAIHDVKHNHPKCGGVILNETRKLLRKFENKRQIHNESSIELEEYVRSLKLPVLSLERTQAMLKIAAPQPCADFMSCQMCEFNSICETYGTKRIPVEEQLLDEFQMEFQKRECDHLDEKAEREVMK